MELKAFAIIALLGLMVIGVLSFAQAAPPSDAPGNILKRITDLENLVANLGDQIANMQLIPGPQGPQGEQGPAGATVHFGEVEFRGSGSHMETTDGFLCVSYTLWESGQITFYSSSYVWPMTIGAYGSELIYQHGVFTVPVKAGDTWAVHWNNAQVTIYWIPLTA